MTTLFAILSLSLVLFIIVTIGAILWRPGVFDRIIGIGVVGTKTTVLLAYIGLLFGRPDAFVDIALTYALLNFILVLAVARYMTGFRVTE
jgi:multicomponent Na+:H+ antiporter subunit F